MTSSAPCDRIKDWHEAIPLKMAVYRRDSAGCCLHIALDDGNVTDKHLAWCEKNMCGNQGCAEMLATLRRMSVTQRAKLAAYNQVHAERFTTAPRPPQTPHDPT